MRWLPTMVRASVSVVGNRLPTILPQRQGLPALVLRTRPEDPPLGLVDLHVVDARLAPAHVALVVELPLLVAIAAPPLPGRVVALVLEAHGDPIAVERPQVLAQPVVELALLPLALEEGDDLVAPVEELVAVAPLRVGRVGLRDALGIERVPGVLGGLDLLAGGLLGERRQRGSHARHHRRAPPRACGACPRAVPGARRRATGADGCRRRPAVRRLRAA